MVVSAQLRASTFLAHTNTASKFPYLGRFPAGFEGSWASDARLVQGNLAATFHATDYAHGYIETLYSDVFSFPAANQGSFQVRQAYLVIGGPNLAPWYVFVGKKTVNFGDFRSLSPFSQAMPWHYFAPLAEGIGLGYADDQFNFSVTALNGSRGIRVVDSRHKGDLNNLALAGQWKHEFAPKTNVVVGGGFLLGTIYDAATAEHTNPEVVGINQNPAWDIHAILTSGPWQVSTEFTSTVRDWPVTQHPVTAVKAEAARELIETSLPLIASVSWSIGKQGPANSSFESNQQLVVGLEYRPSVHFRLACEYVHSSGFAPLIDITTVSDRNTKQDTILAAMTLVF